MAWTTGICALIVAAGLMYVSPTGGKGDTADEPARTASVDAVQAFISQREEVRRLETLRLSAVAADEDADESVRALARRELVQMTAFMEAETTIEGVLRMRGFEDAVATVHEGSVNVLVRNAELTQSQSAQILELVMRETGQRGGNIKIMTVD